MSTTLLSPPLPEAAAGDNPTKTVDVLLVEDDPNHAELIARAFKARAGGLRLALTGSLAEARAYLLECGRNPPRLVIADWRLPDGDGIQLLTRSGDGCPAPVIIMTSYGNERVAVEAMRSGAIDYVVKSEATLIDMPHVAERALREWTIARERSRIANELRISEERLRTVVVNAPVMLFSTDAKGAFTLLEGKGLEVMRIDAGALMGRLAFDVWRGVSDARAGLRAALAGEADKRVVQIGAATFEMHFSPVRDESGVVAGVIGVAIDVTERAHAAERLLRASRELQEAYDATLVGWSRALELREHETAGHSQRVVDLTLSLARALGVSEEETIHIRRGALLHDIGKMAIPDHILLKPDALTPDEWIVMKRHPHLAFEMLKAIAYLKPALDVPYCHHERWDGKGYPRGLSGEKIPLAARIFAVADVWDALTSDRPYRPAWSEEDACAYLNDQAGAYFDPEIVERFLTIVCLQERK